MINLASLVFLATFNILFTPSTGASTHTCTAYYRNSVAAGVDVTIIDPDVAVGSGPTSIKTPWASVTCSIIGPWPSNSAISYAQITSASVDPNLPGLEVIACIKAFDALGTSSACINADQLTPISATNPLLGGSINSPVSNASDQ